MTDDRQYRGAVRAPRLEGEWVWGDPHPLAALVGRPVVLDFWAACCINCQHLLPVLWRLHGEFGDRVAVVGVHSAKYAAERDPALVAMACDRLSIAHPVISDPDRRLWDQYAVRAWPTLVFLDPRGRVWRQRAGEIAWVELRELLGGALAAWESEGALTGREPTAGPVHETGTGIPLRGASGPLRYPGGVAVDAPRRRIVVSDSGHHRLLVTDLDGSVTAVIGSGREGFDDGPAATATFSDPQGAALSPDGATLHVADRGNHAIRRIDLRTGDVTTVAGTGERGGYRLDGEAPARVTALASPWDLAWQGGRLLVAMAGTHQLWAYHPDRGTVAVVAGSGAESIHDGPLAEATFAQPSGVAVTGDVAWSLDSESSSVRRVDLRPGGRVRRVVGRGLFDFGDRDGGPEIARMQHPLGLAVDADVALVIADTYNNRIRRLDPGSRELTTLAGTGATGHGDGSLATATFREPAGVAVDGDRVWVADRGNHAIRLIDRAVGTVTTVPVRLR